MILEREARIAELERKLAEAREQRDNALENCARYRTQAEESTRISDGLMDRLEEEKARAIAAGQELAHADECICDLMHLMHNGFWGRMVFNLRRQVNGLRKAVKYIRLSHIDHAGHRAGKYRKTVEVCDGALAIMPQTAPADETDALRRQVEGMEERDTIIHDLLNDLLFYMSLAGEQDAYQDLPSVVHAQALAAAPTASDGLPVDACRCERCEEKRAAKRVMEATGEPADKEERDACPYPDCDRGSCIGCEHDRFGEERDA